MKSFSIDNNNKITNINMFLYLLKVWDLPGSACPTHSRTSDHPRKSNSASAPLCCLSTQNRRITIGSFTICGTNFTYK